MKAEGTPANPVCRFGHVDASRTAVIIAGQKISYGRFTADIDDLVVWLGGQGLSGGQRIGIFLRHPYWAWVCLLAAMRMGLTHAILTYRFREETAAAGLFDVVLGEFEGVDLFDSVRRILVFSPQGMAPFAEQAEFFAPERRCAAPQALAGSRHLILTSGTTGKPKAVSLDDEMLRNRVALVQSSQGLTADTRLLPLLGMDTIAGFRYPLATWQAGGCVLFGVPIPGKMKFGQLPYLPCNLLLTAPARLRELLGKSLKPWQGRAERKIIVVGSRLPILVRDEALAHACHRISMVYGATETGSIAIGDAGLLDRHPGAVGFVVDCASLQIVDRTGHPRPPGEKGIVRTRTPLMVTGYEGGPEGQPDAVSCDGWFYPGDQGVLFEDGLLAITGRLTESLNIGGLKISLVDFEAVLEKLPEVQDACATVLRLDTGDRLALAVVCDQAVDLAALSQKIRALLPVRRSFIMLRVPRIPRNDRGKIERNALAEKLLKFIAAEVRTKN